MPVPRYPPFRKIRGKDVNLIMDYIESGLTELFGFIPDVGTPAVVSNGLPNTYVSSLIAGTGVVLTGNTGDVLIQGPSAGVSCAVAYQSVAQGSGSTNPFVSGGQVQFQSVLIDVFSEFDATGRFTAHTNGNYLINSHVELQPAGSPTTTFPTGSISLKKVGTGYVGGGLRGSNVFSPNLTGVSMSEMLPLLGGDQLEVWITVDATACVTFTGLANVWFSCARLP